MHNYYLKQTPTTDNYRSSTSSIHHLCLLNTVQYRQVLKMLSHRWISVNSSPNEEIQGLQLIHGMMIKGRSDTLAQAVVGGATNNFGCD